VVRTAVVPQRGGMDEIGNVNFPWTGGDPYENTVTAPIGDSCYRSLDPDKLGRLKKSVFNPYLKQESCKSSALQ